MSSWTRVAAVAPESPDDVVRPTTPAGTDESAARPRGHERFGHRTLVALAIVIALAAGAYAVGRPASSSGAESRRAASPASDGASRAAATGAPTKRARSPESNAEASITASIPLALQQTCHAQGAERVECGPNGAAVSVEVRRVDDASEIAGGLALVAQGLVPGTGDPVCSLGRSELRRWSAPATPRVAAGTYVCRAGNPAELWWSVDEAHLVGHAIAADADLGALFRWWLELDER